MKDLLTNILAGISALLAIALSFNILPADFIVVLQESVPQIVLGIFSIVSWLTGKKQDLTGTHE